jgi:hypothetical protein
MLRMVNISTLLRPMNQVSSLANGLRKGTDRIDNLTSFQSYCGFIQRNGQEKAAYVR